jgi:predicted 2-oxoglutarate/Fe(II)-dependent dioxygenase YbiX|tara:strand:- start:3206 stop:3745 length:540 start_codon:yes stop_codon:yes gene_type:complete
MNYLEAVVQIDNIVEDIFCKEIIDYYDKIDLKSLGVVDPSDKTSRNVLGKHLDYKEDKIIFDKINKKIEKVYSFYKIKFPKIILNKISEIDLLKYDVGGYNKYHVDVYTDIPRSLSVIINLNNDYKGGDLVFVDQKNKETKRCKLNKGSVIFFPSNFMYPHGIEKITEGTRYSIVAWLQ